MSAPIKIRNSAAATAAREKAEKTAALRTKTWAQLTDRDKDELLKLVAIRLGLIQSTDEE